MDNDLSQLCRLCLKKSEYRRSIFTDNLLDKIESLTFIRILKDHSLPQTCCESCVTNVNSSYKFQQCIIESDKKLRQLALENEYEIIQQAKEDPQLFEILHADGSPDVDTEILSPKSENLDIELDDQKSVENVFIKSDKFKDNDESEGLDDNTEMNCVKLWVFNKQETQTLLNCDCCDKKFKTKRCLNKHRMKFKLEKCPICNIAMRSDNLKKHLQTHVVTPEICSICGKTAKNKESLRGHINYQHRNTELIKCEPCNRDFKTKVRYDAHIKKVHLGIRNHQCDICGKTFFGRNYLKKHINITHRGARPYECPYCNKGFSSPYARKTHIRQHTQETPFHCDMCAAGFRQKVSLLTHVKSKHSNTSDNL